MKTLFSGLFIMCESQGQPVLAFVIKIMAPVYTIFLGQFHVRRICLYVVVFAFIWCIT